MLPRYIATAILLFTAGLSAFAAQQINCAGATQGSGPGTPTSPCPTITITGEVFDPPMPKGPNGQPRSPNTFYGYADPSVRKDPNSSYTYLAYSYAVAATEPHTAYGLHVIDLNLAYSQNGGATWTKQGTLFHTTAFNTTPASPPLAAWNITSHETVDLFPFNYNGSTLWIQAHQEYLVDADGTEQIEGEQPFTNFISVTAVQGGTPADLLMLGNGSSSTGQTTVPEARLGNAYTAPVLGITQNLSALPSDVKHLAANCDSWTQQTLFQQGQTLYMGVQCTQSGQGVVDQNDFGAFVFSTQPYSGSPGVNPLDASTWPWSFVGVIATQANAQALWKVEGPAVQSYDPSATGYAFFTEVEFAMSSDGVHPIAILTPSQFDIAAGDTVVQFGCRAVRLSFSPLSLDLSGSGGAPNVIDSVIEQDLYTGTNDGPAACAYEPLSINGVLLVHKVDGPPHWSTLLESLAKP